MNYLIVLAALSMFGGECPPQNPANCEGAGQTVIVQVESCFGSGNGVLAPGDFASFFVQVSSAVTACDLTDASLAITANGVLIFEAAGFTIGQDVNEGFLQAEIPTFLMAGDFVEITTTLNGVVAAGDPSPFCTLFAASTTIQIPLTCRCDTNRDGNVDLDDVKNIVENFFMEGWPVGVACDSDLNRDGIVDQLDLKNWFQTGVRDITPPCWPSIPFCPGQVDASAAALR